ncbi:MAG: A/G-specific adenine glycosylase [Pseudomonadota bacterium]
MNIIETEKSKAGNQFAQRLLDWYCVHARAMPWRISPENHKLGERPDPYRIWLSEIMLQQTQVATVKDYFLKFVDLWPTVSHLARADLEDVLKAWAGLGYYSRARNLKKCADTIVAEYEGNFPKSYDALKMLPGIGDYTASAIASIAFDQPVPVVDGNVERVMARHYEIREFFPGAKPKVRAMLEGILDPNKPGEFAQAMMDLGATICSPKRPACALCPINADCLAFQSGTPELYPFKQPKAEKPTRKGAAFVLKNKAGHIFLCKRPSHGLLAGMTQVPTTDWNSNQDGGTEQDSAPLPAAWQRRGTIRHTFTHFHLELTIWQAQIDHQISLDGWWCKAEDLGSEALPTVFKKVLSAAL